MKRVEVSIEEVYGPKGRTWKERCAELERAWKLMRDDRDKWKRRVNEPYDDSVIAELEAAAQMKDKRIDWTVQDNTKKAIKIEELEAEKEGYEEQWAKFEDEIERLRESEEFFSGKCGDAELKILELEAKLNTDSQHFEILCLREVDRKYTTLRDGLQELITELEAPSAEKYVDGEYIPPRESVTERLRALLDSINNPKIDSSLSTVIGRTCEWQDDIDFWAGSCGITWAFTEGGIKDNNLNFCPQCGGKVIADGDEDES